MDRLRKSTGFVSYTGNTISRKVGRSSSIGPGVNMYFGRKKGKLFFGIISITASGELLKETTSSIILERDKCARLSITNSDIKRIEDDFFTSENLQQLNSLELFRNKLKKLPVTIISLEVLKTIDLSWNKISVFPECLIKLPKLKEINLSNNKILKLPECINEFASLMKLKLDNNLIHELPTIMSENITLKKISLKNNPLLLPPLYM